MKNVVLIVPEISVPAQMLPTDACTASQSLAQGVPPCAF